MRGATDKNVSVNRKVDLLVLYKRKTVIEHRGNPQLIVYQIGYTGESEGQISDNFVIVVYGFNGGGAPCLVSGYVSIRCLLASKCSQMHICATFINSLEQSECQLFVHGKNKLLIFTCFS